MFKDKNIRKILLSALVIVLLIGTTAFAADKIFNTKITAVQGRLKLEIDGKDVTKLVESQYDAPAFTVVEYGHRAYVPVRALGDLMNIDVKYDDKTHTASFVDTEKNSLKNELLSKNSEIELLKKEIKELKEGKKEEKKETTTKTTLKELEAKLNKSYGVTNDVHFNISLKESSSRITIDVTVDPYDAFERNAWRKMNNRDQEDLIKNIISDVEKEYKNARISGELYNNNERRSVFTFEQSNTGRLIITDKNYGYDEFIDDAEFYVRSALNKNSSVDSIKLNEASNGSVYGKIVLKERSNEYISSKQIEDAFTTAEYDLDSRYSTRTYFDVDITINRYNGSIETGRYLNNRYSNN